jgi:hypothetical protein
MKSLSLFLLALWITYAIYVSMGCNTERTINIDGEQPVHIDSWESSIQPI